MSTERTTASRYGLKQQGIRNVSNVYWNLATPMLYEEAVRRREARLAHLGPLVVRTGQHTARWPRDKFVVREPSSAELVAWGDMNQPMEPERFEALRRRLLAYMQGRDIFVQDCFVGADPRFRVPIRIIAEHAWHSLFARDMFIQARPEELAEHKPRFAAIVAPNFDAEPEVDGTRSGAFIVLHFGRGLVLIGGTAYAGEMKKSIFTLVNYLLPQQNVLSMHCSANVGQAGDVALFFGLSGTGKTALAADPERRLIGDDEHGWSDTGVFNLEGGCYAKVIHLSAEDEPEIYGTTRRFGTILENVGFNIATGRVDLDDASLTEDTRAAYPITHLPRVQRDGLGGHPRHIFMLTSDAFGVLPPLARLTPAQAVYYFLLGYTAQVVGPEGSATEPLAVFSPCFGGPLMVLAPAAYARLLNDAMNWHKPQVWLINTGWTGGPFGIGSRIPIGQTRAMLHAALDGSAARAAQRRDPIFGLAVPTECPGVPKDMLDPRNAWVDKEAYDQRARQLAGLFTEHFSAFADEVPDEVRGAGPQ